MDPGDARLAESSPVFSEAVSGVFRSAQNVGSVPLLLRLHFSEAGVNETAGVGSGSCEERFAGKCTVVNS